MSITWGPWSSNNRLQAGIEIIQSPSTVTSATVSVSITRKVYLRTRYASFETTSSDTWFLTGSGADLSGNTDWNLPDMGYKLMGQDTETVTLNYGSTQTWTQTGRCHSYFAYPGTDVSATTTRTIPARPYSVPTAPSGVSSVRNSDTQATTTWTRHATTAAPYSSQVVEMRTWTGAAWGGWSALPPISGSATSYVKTGLIANRVYQFRVKATNGAGASGYGTSSTSVYMTPAAPANVTSSVNAGGSQISTTWTVKNYTGTSTPVKFEIERSVAGGAFAALADDVTAPPYVDTSPGVGTNQYRVKAEIESLSLASAFVNGNTVSTIAPPLAPSNLFPNGISVDLAGNVTFTWQHNHAGDGAAQSHYTLETSSDGGSTWDPQATNVASTVSAHVLPAGTLANGATYQWRVQTQGATGAAFGPFSAVGTFTGSDTPVVSITSPGATATSLPLTVTWSYTQAQGSPQVAYTAVLKDALGNVIETKTATGSAATSVAFDYLVQDTEAYSVEVTVTAASGIVSATDTQSFTIDLPSPAPTLLVPEYQPCTGTVLISIIIEDPEAGEVGVDRIIIERRVPGQEDWTTLTDSMSPSGGDFIDTVPVLNAVNEYRATSVSTTPSYSINEPVSITTSDAVGAQGFWVFVNYGPGFQSVLRARRDPQISEDVDKARATQQFLGRRRPVLFVGENTTWDVAFAGSLHYEDGVCAPADDCRLDSSPAQWRTLQREADVVAYRDFYGRRVFGMMSAIALQEIQYPGVAAVSFKVTESDYVESYTVGI